MPDRSDEFRAAAGSCHFIPITEPRRRGSFVTLQQERKARRGCCRRAIRSHEDQRKRLAVRED